MLKAESLADKVEWVNKLSNIIQPSRGQTRTPSEGGLTMRQSLSDGSLVSHFVSASVCSSMIQIPSLHVIL